MLLNLLLARKKHGLKQREVAERAGVTAVKMSRIENGHLVPTIHEALRIAAVLDAPVDRLFDTTK